MAYSLYNMDAYFYHSLGVYRFEAQWERLQKIDFEGNDRF